MISVVRKFSKLLDKNQKGKVIYLVLLMMLGALLETLGLSLILPLTSVILNPDVLYKNKYAIFICRVFNISTHKQFVIICLISLILIYIIKNFFLIFQNAQQARFVYNNRFLIQQKLFHVYLHKNYETYLSASTGEIMRIIHGDVVDCFGLLSNIMSLASESIISIALCIAIIVIDPLMSVFIAGLLLIFILIIRKVIKPILEEKGNILRKENSSSYSLLREATEGIKEIKIAQVENFFENKFSIIGRNRISSEKWNYVINVFPRMLIEAGCVSITLSVIVILILLGRDVTSLVPTISAFCVAAVKLMPSVNRINNCLNDISYHEPSIDNVLKSLNETIDYDNTNVSDTLLEMNESIEMKDIVYKYPNSDTFVLNKASMNIPVGKSVGIVGASGAGKTTSADILLGLLSPNSGKILVDGKNVMEDYSSWLNSIAYIPQAIFMLDSTIRDNVSFGLAADEDKIWDTLKEAQMYDFVKSLPEGLDTRIGERGIRLSGGQRQRIGIARALYKNSPIIVFDEATSSLDNETESAIMESINFLQGKKTMIIIAHRLQTIEKCDMVYRVEGGKIVRER